VKSSNGYSCPSYVIDERGRAYLLVPAIAPPFFALVDRDRFYPGGLGAHPRWESVADDDPRIPAEARAALGPDLHRVRDFADGEHHYHL
jgi:hypothetical protein